jgi:hypothetical protein
MPDPKDLKQFEAALMGHLNHGEMDKTLLKKASSSIVALKKEGLVIDRVFVKGKPRPDRVIVNGIIDPEFWKKFGNLGGHFKRFEVFPFGIINPEGFHFKGTM